MNNKTSGPGLDRRILFDEWVRGRNWRRNMAARGGSTREALDLVVRARRVLLPDGEAGCAVGVRDGRISAVESPHVHLSAASELEFGDDVVVMPGLVDSHVHICEPGNTEWEGFATATRAAAAGGITTLVDMPLDSVPATVDVAALELKQKAAESKIHVDVAFWGGVIPGNLDQLESLWKAGIVGFKCFLADSGSTDFPPVDAATMEAALGIVRGLGAPLIVHAESAEVAARLETVHGGCYADYLASRPRGLENLAVAQVIEAARRTGCHAHVCHLSSSDALPMISSARREGVRLTAETCPHYLALCAEDIADGQTICKCSPPVREAANRELLWEGLRAKALDLVVSDHSPCPLDMKTSGGSDFAAAWGGISSLQYSLPLVWSGARLRGFSLSDVAKWMSEGPARLAGLTAKGSIAPGQDADFCVFAPDETIIVDPATCGEIVDGWETKRRCEPGHDWALVRLGVPGTITSVDVDTSFFTGNYPEFCQIEACGREGYPGPGELTGPSTEWVEISTASLSILLASCTEDR